ncbi:MAG: hypothetical protein IPP93_04395 [Chitinophagaceae bacterium]|nr:hypothetical protein [Chitinophagaceae bacterium]
MGLGMTSTYVINLPRAAKKAEGKGLTLSADKKQVIVKAGIEDFFDNPSQFEFSVEY